MMKRLIGAVGLAAVFACATASAARADYVWDGPRLTAEAVFGVGVGTNVFNTDGFFNDTPGDSFSYPLRGITFGFSGGYDWQVGAILLGIDTTVLTGHGGVSNYDIQSPYDPDQGFELKFHWGATVDARVGFALGRTLLYAEAGPAFGHIITEANDDVAGRVRLGRWPFGVSAGFGVEHAVTDRMTVGIGYRYLAYAPVLIVSNGPTPTDHTVQYRAHMIKSTVTFRYDQPEDARGRSLAGFGWDGAYVGTTFGSPASFHAVAGYNLVLGDRFVLGPEVRGAVYTCCNLRFGADVLARAGVVIDEHLLVYGEAGVRFRNGLFATVGGGMEIAMSPRISGVMELSALNHIGDGWGEVSFMGGIHIHLGNNG